MVRVTVRVTVWVRIWVRVWVRIRELGFRAVGGRDGLASGS